MLMHPTNSKLDGQDLSGFKDPDGKAIFMGMVAVAKSQGGGIVGYRWPKPGSSEPLEKISYVELFQPWEWVLGSGIYIDDVQAVPCKDLESCRCAPGHWPTAEHLGDTHQQEYYPAIE